MSASGSARNSTEVSHGRGGMYAPSPPTGYPSFLTYDLAGAGNIGQDSTPYGDGEIVREGVVGDHGDGAYSSGRGGAANIGSPGLKATARKDDVVVPEIALRPSMENENFHVGRGGEGNVHTAPAVTQKHPEGLADKLKNKLFKKKVAKKEETTT
ncbi:hypothetical protein LSUB1_G004740 [Lachnellula subtilissima]|uniref:Uncharacterized protein n=1 Tax=Lachnellula subtilissima TaxID=602034 RepID=A0A8H8RL80_9HELO|nr:hypothetical protein LSUB1_G004740 [Lachnellula subtilissima]